MKDCKEKLVNLVMFIMINCMLFLFCIWSIAPFFKISSGLKTLAEKENEITYLNYKLNVKKFITKEDIIIDINTGKELQEN